MLAAAALLAGLSWLVWSALDSALGRSLLAQIASVGGGIAAGGCAYAAAVMLLRIPEAGQIVRLLRSRFGRAAEDGDPG